MDIYVIERRIAMIFDTVKNAKAYGGLGKEIQRVLEAAAAYTPENYTTGQVKLDGDDLYMNLAAYETHAFEDGLFEAHRQYLDVMVMIEGSEMVYVKRTHLLKNLTMEYTPHLDALLAKEAQKEDVSAILLSAGDFLVLFPDEAHAPGCDYLQTKQVKKIIGKVRIG